MASIGTLSLAAPAAEAQGYQGEAVKQLGAAAGEKGAVFGQARDPRAVAAYTVQIIMGTVGIVFIGYLVFAGYLLLVSGGSEEKVTQGKRIIFQAILGIVISMSAFSVALLADRYFREATGSGPPAGWYAGAGFEIEQDTGKFFNTDPLEQDTGLGVDFLGPGGSAKTW